MNIELDNVLMCLRGDFGVIVAIVAWQGVLRLCLKFLNERLKLWMEQALPAENEALHRFLGSLPYRLFVFGIDTLLSVKLPETARKEPTP
jgi:hypothetical protein